MALIGFGGKYHAPATLFNDRRYCVHCTEGCVGLGVGLDGHGKPSLHRRENTELSSP
jgi:hypothetical protein